MINGWLMDDQWMINGWLMDDQWMIYGWLTDDYNGKEYLAGGAITILKKYESMGRMTSHIWNGK